VRAIFDLLLKELKQATRLSEHRCSAVADRLAQEVDRICTESQRIQNSGDVESWATTLARHRLQQLLSYYRLGSRRGRVELHSTLSAVVYRYITPPQVYSSYQARLILIEDFLQSFYIESLSAFRREYQLPPNYTPRIMLDLAEYMAFTERYAKRRIPLPGRRSQQLIILRSQTFSQQQPAETCVDIDLAADGALADGDDSWGNASLQRVREQMVAQDIEPGQDALRDHVVAELLSYLRARNQEDCAHYFKLRLQDLSASEIETRLNLTPRQRDYLQQRFKYHLLRFALSHEWELVHQWLEADLDRNLGLTDREWQQFLTELTPQQKTLLQLHQAGESDSNIAHRLGYTITQAQKQWSQLLAQAWEIRNRPVSGSSKSTDE